jgi:hypothetical protein
MNPLPEQHRAIIDDPASVVRARRLEWESGCVARELRLASATVTIRTAIFCLIVLMLSACGVGTPFRVETRDPTSETEQQKLERRIDRVKQQERTRGGGL